MSGEWPVASDEKGSKSKEPISLVIEHFAAFPQEGLADGKDVLCDRCGKVLLEGRCKADAVWHQPFDFGFDGTWSELELGFIVPWIDRESRFRTQCFKACPN